MGRAQGYAGLSDELVSERAQRLGGEEKGLEALVALRAQTEAAAASSLARVRIAVDLRSRFSICCVWLHFRRRSSVPSENTRVIIQMAPAK